MPYKPLKPCAWQGCPNLTNKKYCEEHEKIANRNYEKYERGYKPKERYGRDWTRIRGRYIEAHPYCEECFKMGAMVMAEHVHHVIPLDEGGTSEFSNLESLCKSCHSRIHAKRGDRWH